MSKQAAGIHGSALQWSAVSTELAGHLDVAAERQDGDAIVGFAVVEADDARSEANGEGFYADAAELGDDKVA